ncbi:MAG: hypothetical protein R2747_11935 [Pyrinomonadaceae bacterium]
MFCPKCATQRTDDQKYCRVCGLNLDIISEIMTDETVVDKFKSASDRQKKRKNRIQSFGVILIIQSLLIGCVIPILIGLGVPDLMSYVMILAGLAGVVMFSGVTLTIYGDMKPKPVEPEEEKETPALYEKGVGELPAGDDFEPAPTVIEGTTRRLDTNKIKVSRRSDGGELT